MKWVPLYDKIVVRRNKPPEAVGSLVVPDEAKKPQQTGLVVAAGEGRLLLHANEPSVCPLMIRVGDEVMFGPYSGSALPDVGEDYVLLREDEILMVARPEDESVEAPDGTEA